jgi:hypothetical protein
MRIPSFFVIGLYITNITASNTNKILRRLNFAEDVIAISQSENNDATFHSSNNENNLIPSPTSLPLPSTIPTIPIPTRPPIYRNKKDSKEGSKGKSKKVGKLKGSAKDSSVTNQDEDDSITEGGKGKGKGKSKKGGLDDDTLPGGKGKGKGKGKGGGGSTGLPTSYPTPKNGSTVCKSSVARSIQTNVPNTIVINPPRCCNYVGPIVAFITHAKTDTTTTSGFEPFWDSIYTQILTICMFRFYGDCIRC